MKDDIVTIVPIYKAYLSPSQKISLRHLCKFLRDYKTYALVPKSLQMELKGFELKSFDDHFFDSIHSYSKLLLSPKFYEAFRDYKYILIYQLDCLVFSDELIKWCEAGFDYIGAPWFKSRIDPSKGFSRVGNGGLSLRKVEPFLKVLDSKRFTDESMPYIKDVLFTYLEDVHVLPPVRRFIKRLSVLRDIRRGVRWYIDHYTLNEDHFWADRASLFYPGFKIAPVDVALRFSFERFPRYCFEQNNYQLPFGCHAWAKWDRKFWTPHLLP